HTLAQRIGAMEREIVQIEDLKSSLDKQAALYEQELSLAQKNYERQSKLHRERLVSDTELEELEGALIQSKRQLEALRSGIINHQLRIEQLQAEMTVLRADRSDELADQQMEVQQWTDRLLAALQQWKHQYLIHAPIAGKINFDQIRSSQQFIEQGKVVFTIIPEQEQGKIIAQCLVPLRGVGKIDNGCRANIRLDAYPHREFGVIASKIEKIALIPKENEDGESNYQMEMHLPDQLITSYEKTIPFRQGMTGRVHVITEDRRVVERIFDRILSIVKNG
ncbi:MAG: HlyD family efflux transporter periplasmic adaptor subunit, partial [Bacteroidota bacterium]